MLAVHDVGVMNHIIPFRILSFSQTRGVIPTVPSSNNYDGGFATELMFKDLTIATQVAKQVDAVVPLGDRTYQLYNSLIEKGVTKKDFTIIYDFIMKN